MPLRRILATKIVSVGPEATRTVVERVFAKYGFRSIPVVDGEGRMQGVVRFRKIVENMERP